MKIVENDTTIEVEDGSLVEDVFDRDKVILIDGYAVARDYALSDGESVTSIEKGVMPSLDTLKKLITARNTPNMQQKLDAACVAIVGVGGLGSNIAVMLARVGVGKIVIIDDDIVEPSNLNRQSFFISDIGKPKVDAINQQIANINPFVQVLAKRCHANQHNIVDLCCGASVVCEAVDDPATKAMIVNKLIEDCPNVWLVASSGMAGIYSANLIKTTKKMNRLFVCGDGQNEAKKGEGLMSPRVVACAAHQANMALRLLMDIEEE